MESESSQERREAIRSWAIVIGIGVVVLLWGSFLFITVGDKGPPPWDYSIVEDIPGEAASSLYSSRAYQGYVPRPTKVEKQHVSQPPEESLEVTPKGNQ